MVQKIAVPSHWPMPRYSLGQAVWTTNDYYQGCHGEILGMLFDLEHQQWSYLLSPAPGSEDCDDIFQLEEDLVPIQWPLRCA